MTRGWNCRGGTIRAVGVARCALWRRVLNSCRCENRGFVGLYPLEVDRSLLKQSINSSLHLEIIIPSLVFRYAVVAIVK